MPEYSAKMQSKVEYLWLERIFAAQLGLAWANIGNALSILLAILLTAHKKKPQLSLSVVFPHYWQSQRGFGHKVVKIAANIKPL